MAEAIKEYPRWERAYSGAPRFLVIAREELIKIYRNKWTGYAVALFLALAILGFAGNRVGATRLENLVDSLKLIEWAALAVVAIAAGPAILEDRRRDALELYLSRAMRPRDYVLGKGLAIWISAVVVVLLPALAYYVSALVTVDDLPGSWNWAWLGLIGHAVIWGTVIAGIGLGLSVVLNSSRAATLVLFGAIFGLDVVLSNLLEGITNDARVQVLSPIADLHQQNSWLFLETSAPYDFPWWWGALALAGLAAVGWGLFVWRRPRLKGVE